MRSDMRLNLRRIETRLGFAAGVVVLALGAGAARANLLGDPGFETLPTVTFSTIPANSTAIAPWSVDAGNVDVVKQNANGFVLGAAFEGTQYLDLHGTVPGTLSQFFPTERGVMYTLSFAYANNYFNTTSANATVGITAGATTVIASTAFNHSTSVANALNWTVFTVDFAGTGTTNTLTFTGDPAGSPTGGMLLDAVSVAPAVPEPTGAVGLVVAGLLAGGRRRR